MFELLISKCRPSSFEYLSNSLACMNCRKFWKNTRNAGKMCVYTRRRGLSESSDWLVSALAYTAWNCFLLQLMDGSKPTSDSDIVILNSTRVRWLTGRRRQLMQVLSFIIRCMLGRSRTARDCRRKAQLHHHTVLAESSLPHVHEHEFDGAMGRH